MLQYLFDNHRVFNTGYDLYPATAFLTLLDFDADGRPLKTRFNLWAHVIE
ncbi:MAG: hypothetical protein HOI25_06865 [Proteobacteria bacterium]|nr:hypothetical protein [Pseudomonadota bacterium]